MVTRVREHHSTFSDGIGNTQELSILPGHFLVLRKGKVLLSYLSVILCGDGLKPTHSPFFPRKLSSCFSLTEGRSIAMANYICHSGRQHNKGRFRVQYVRESNQLALWPRSASIKVLNTGLTCVGSSGHEARAHQWQAQVGLWSVWILWISSTMDSRKYWVKNFSKQGRRWLSKSKKVQENTKPDFQ